MPVFSLPMYDWPQFRAATDTRARGIAKHLRGHGFTEAPLEILRQDEYQELWNAPDLISGHSILDRNDYAVIANLERGLKSRGHLILWKAA